METFGIEYNQILNQTGSYIDASPFFLLVVLSLASWRIASLFAREQGPWGMFERIRLMVGTYYLTGDSRKISTYKEFIEVPNSLTMYREDATEMAKLLGCVWCSTLWIATATSWAYLLSGQQWILWCAFPFSVSAVAIIIDRMAHG